MLHIKNTPPKIKVKERERKPEFPKT